MWYYTNFQEIEKIKKANRKRNKKDEDTIKTKLDVLVMQNLDETEKKRMKIKKKMCNKRIIFVKDINFNIVR